MPPTVLTRSSAPPSARQCRAPFAQPQPLQASAGPGAWVLSRCAHRLSRSSRHQLALEKNAGWTREVDAPSPLTTGVAVRGGLNPAVELGPSLASCARTMCLSGRSCFATVVCASRAQVGSGAPRHRHCTTTRCKYDSDAGVRVASVSKRQRTTAFLAILLYAVGAFRCKNRTCKVPDTFSQHWSRVDRDPSTPTRGHASGQPTPKLPGARMGVLFSQNVHFSVILGVLFLKDCSTDDTKQCKPTLFRCLASPPVPGTSAGTPPLHA